MRQTAGKQIEAYVEILYYMPGGKQLFETVHHDLQLDEHLEQHEKGWIIQKIGWGILYLGLILALAGFFGTGPVSYKTQNQHGNSVAYERFLRYEAEAEMTFTIANSKDSITLEIPQQYLEYIELKSITPLPVHNKTTNKVTTYYFNASGNAAIHCNVMAKRTGSITATLIVNRTPFTIDHQIYP